VLPLRAKGTRRRARWLEHEQSDFGALDAEAIKAKLEALKSEHRDLDEVIDRCSRSRRSTNCSCSAEEAQARLKDQILKLESS